LAFARTRDKQVFDESTDGMLPWQDMLGAEQGQAL
jgi:hypothetical protein